jgi:hypothetical protein
MPRRKRNRKSQEIAGKCDLFDALPDDLVISILCKLSSFVFFFFLFDFRSPASDWGDN